MEQPSFNQLNLNKEAYKNVSLEKDPHKYET